MQSNATIIVLNRYIQRAPSAVFQHWRSARGTLVSANLRTSHMTINPLLDLAKFLISSGSCAREERFKTLFFEFSFLVFENQYIAINSKKKKRERERKKV